MNYDTVVVGLGAAGVTAAVTLAKAGKKVLALEASDRIGGRVKTVQLGDGVVEEGAEWIHGTVKNCIYETAVKNNITVLAHNIDMDIFRSDGSKADGEIIKDLISFCLDCRTNSAPGDTELSLGDFIIMRLTQYLEGKYPRLTTDRTFINDFLDFMNLVINNYEAANDWKEVSIQSSYEACPGEQHMSWHKYGYKTYFELLLNTYNNGPGLPNLDIKLNSEVEEIKWPHDSRANVEITINDGSIFRSDNVIVTVSLGVLKERYTTLFNPTLAGEKISAINNISMGVMDKIILKFDKPWCPHAPSFKALFWNKGDKDKVPEDDVWITKVFAASNPLGSSNALTLWTSGDVAKLVEILPEDVVKSKLVELLQKFMGTYYVIPEPTAIIRSTWYLNPLTRGSYSYDNMLTPLYPDLRSVLAAPLLDTSGRPRVLFAGEATNTKHFSTVHGASETGLREAKRLLPNSKI
ncbi:spermine oxidase-like isoform X1 [Leptidea sinapis]|nr:spermine oxidase-like isoform X1 [Leptidea sinapis]XP_050677303.1 spermine oxidase-like isoform X1 [Leptidea sinapis]XP_050677304.1 spermine oxidase-like isoform X1 [Leptidea sinapis]